MILGRVSDFDLNYELNPESLEVGERYNTTIKITEVSKLGDGDWEVSFVIEELDL